VAQVKIKYLLRKAGLLYYQRGIPPDLRPHYSGRALILINLKTPDLAKAAKLCAQYAERDDALWRVLRSREGQTLTTQESREAAQALLTSWGTSRGARPTEDSPIWERVYEYMVSRYGEGYENAFYGNQDLNPFYSPAEAEALRLANERPETRRVLLTDCLERYLTEHKRGQDIRFTRDARRAIGIVTQTLGDLPLDAYTRDGARAVRDVLSIGHSTATIRRRLGSISAIFNLGRREFDIQTSNPFEKMQITREGLDATKRLPFSNEELARISAACRKTDDDIRWIVSLQLATGARLAEIVGLRREDVFLDHEVPHIWIRPHEALGRSLKTPGSERLVPLLGIGLWAAERAMGGTVKDMGWLFPRYARDIDIRATHASNTINKWLSESLGIQKTTHSLRHSMKDLLRDAGISEEVSKQLLGHGSRSISDQYGSGFTLPRLAEAMKKASLPFIG
jgi:integrase